MLATTAIHALQVCRRKSVPGLQVLLVDDQPPAEPRAEPNAEPTPAESARQPVGDRALQVAPSLSPMITYVRTSCRDSTAVVPLSRPSRRSHAVTEVNAASGHVQSRIGASPEVSQALPVDVSLQLNETNEHCL